MGAVGIGALHLPYTVVPAQLEALLAALASRATNGSTSAPPPLSRGKLEKMSENRKPIDEIVWQWSYNM